MKITIVGLGLIGGSLGLALKTNSVNKYYITGVDCDCDAMKQAWQEGAVDAWTEDVFDGVKEADMIILCVPVLQIMPMVKKLLPHLKSGVIITDVGSTKKFIGECMKEILPEDMYYVGGHPMAGREKSGFSAANSNLFKNKWYIVIPDYTASMGAVDTVKELAADIGAKIAVMDASSHDCFAAVISHVPHVAAAAMVNLLDCHSDSEFILKLAAGGFRDTTRIASSDADMWADICITNSTAIIDNLGHMQEILQTMIVAMEKGDRQGIHDFFSRAKSKRDAIITEAEGKKEFLP